MSRVGKCSYCFAFCGLGLIFGAIKLPYLAWIGTAVVVSSISVYALDKYLCSSADMILDIEDIEAAQEFERPDEQVVPENPHERLEYPNVAVLSYVDTDGVCPSVPAAITYKYDAMSGQWDAVPVEVRVASDTNVKYKIK